MDYCEECDKDFASNFSKARHDEKFHEEKNSELSDTTEENDETDTDESLMNQVNLVNAVMMHGEAQYYQQSSNMEFQK